ncbi:hypothetical protein BgiBS90_019274 [Biomphalaria glabrata]|nr:hypothetical protein BgiBS90_019274 [Biomphalaria glabrata]
MGARNSKYRYGTHETAEHKRDDRVTRMEKEKGCSKPHKNQIQIRDFSVGHFPEGYQEQDLFELVKLIAGLTVLIEVQFCSEKRLDYWQKTRTKYPGSEWKGKKTNLTGSGRIADIFQDKNGPKFCTCSKCKEDNVQRELWTIVVITATHVVFDDSEANSSSCCLFYDTDDGNYIQINCTKCRWAHDSGDLCFLEGFTCDRELFNNIDNKIKQFNVLWKTIHDRYALDERKEKMERKYYYKRLVVVVSHPHGGPKKISLGRLDEQLKNKLKNDTGYQLFYDSPTCEGSSGAPVYLYGQDWFKVEYVHSGTTEDRQLNHSTTWCPK